jgi:hypothetical protein
MGMPVHPSVLTLTNNFVDYSEALARGEEGLNIYFWYIDCLLQMLAILAVATSLNFRWRLIERPMSFVLALLAIGAALRFVLPALLDPDYLRTGIAADGVLAHLPTTHFATLALGMCMSQVRSLRAKASMAAVMLAFALGLALTGESQAWAMVLVFGTLLLFVPRLPLPRGLDLLVLTLSGASLFVYLTHVQIAGQVLRPLGVPEASVLLWLLTLGSGVLLWQAWQRLADWRVKSGELLRQGVRSLRRGWAKSPGREL